MNDPVKTHTPLRLSAGDETRIPPTADSVERRLERIAAVLAKVGAV